ncbi:MAG: hypothetical protein U9O24_05305 [Campylobacterota bacterium]|nr:hypothetical protein [Campylobacterota bacterium]
MKINYYKKSLVSISKFKDRTIIIKYQNQINKKLATLLQGINPKLSKMYHKKEMEEDNNSKKRNYLWIYIIFGLLFLWGIYKNIKS